MLKISVVIPTFNRLGTLAKCLDRLSAEEQNLDIHEYEVIVTDDGNGPETLKMIEERYKWVKWIAGPKRGPAANRNNGANHAQGEWLAFTDDDCIPDKRWLAGILTAAQTSNADVIEGKTIIPDKIDNPFWRGVENLHGGVLWSCNMAIRREVYLALKGFDEDFLEAGGEDMELAWRIEKNGLKVVFSEGCLVMHPIYKVSWQNLFHRTFVLVKWTSLLSIKTKKNECVKTKLPWHMIRYSCNMLVDLFRNTWHLIRDWDSCYWKSNLFYLVWNWSTFPLVFPVRMYWEYKFRIMHTR